MLTYYSLTFISSEQQVPQVSDFDNHTYDTIQEISSKVQVRALIMTLHLLCLVIVELLDAHILHHVRWVTILVVAMYTPRMHAYLLT